MSTDLDSPEHALCSEALARRLEELRWVGARLRTAEARVAELEAQLRAYDGTPLRAAYDASVEADRLRARVRELEEALEKVGHAGSHGLAEDGCAWCLGEDDYTVAMSEADEHVSTCPVGAALGRKLVATDSVCTTPNGRTDGHGSYVEQGEAGSLVCTFCKKPVDAQRPNEAGLETPWKEGQRYGLIVAAAEARIQGHVALAEMLHRRALTALDDRPSGETEGQWTDKALRTDDDRARAIAFMQRYECELDTMMLAEEFATIRAEERHAIGVLAAENIAQAERLASAHARASSWHAGDAKAVPRELHCEDCDRDYPTWVAPSPLWNEVVRVPADAAVVTEPFLCPTCFALRAERAGIRPTAWVLRPERPEDMPTPAEVATLLRENESLRTVVEAARVIDPRDAATIIDFDEALAAHEKSTGEETKR